MFPFLVLLIFKKIAVSLSGLNQQREAIKSRVSAILKYDKKFKSGDWEQLESCKLILKDLFAEFFQIHNSIASVKVDSGASNIVDDVDTLYHNAVAEITSKMKEITPQQASASAEVKPPPNIIKVPVINLSMFDGQCQKWFPFFRTFKFLVADSADLDNFQKVHYLKSSLEGETLHTLESIIFSGETYRQSGIKIRA